MSLMKDLINKVKSFGAEQTGSELGSIDDDLTTDRVLKGLRRESRVQDEEVEKEVLKNKIKEFNKARDRRNIWGAGQDSDRLLKGNSIMDDHSSMLKEKINILKSDKQSVKSTMLKSRIKKAKRNRGML